MSDDFGFNQQPNYQAPTGQPQNGTAPPPPPTDYDYDYHAPKGKTGRGGGWITLLRVFLWIYFGVICLAGLFIFIGMSQQGGDGALLGFLSLAGCVFLAFVVVAGGMIMLDACQNIRRTAINSARILDVLNQKK